MVQIDPRFLIRNAHGKAGIRWFTLEALRNPLIHAQAQTVNISLLRNRGRLTALHVLDDGIGMDEAGRERCGRQFGFSKVGNGTGLRDTAVTLVQRLEVVTVPVSEPDTAYTMVFDPIVQFYFDICSGTWEGAWLRQPREATPFPAGFKSGTLIMLSDFRVSDPMDPFNEKKMWSTEERITEDKIRDTIYHRFPPDLQSRFLINGKRLPKKPYSGYLLWREPMTSRRGLGSVSGEIHISESGTGHWLMIGGTTGTIPFKRGFLSDLKEHNPDLEEKIHLALRDDQLEGVIRIEVLEGYPTPDREHLLSSFYRTPQAVMVIDELNRIAEKVAKGRREYAAQPASSLIAGMVENLVNTMRENQGYPPTTSIQRNRGPEEPSIDVPSQRLIVSPASIDLEVWDGKSERDTQDLVIKNPMDGESFAFDDQNVGLVKTVTGAGAEIQAIEHEGSYTIACHSSLGRQTTVLVRVHEETISVSDNAFLLRPQRAWGAVGVERKITITRAGETTGPYEWSVEPSKQDGRLLITLTVLPGARQVTVLPLQHGSFTITCLCTKTRKVATSSYEARGMIESPSEPPETGDISCGTGSGHAEEAIVHGTHLPVKFEGRDLVFVVRTDALIEEPFLIQPEIRTILLGDRFMSKFPDSVRLAHVHHAVAEGAAAIQLYDGSILPVDSERYSDFIRHIIESGIGKSKES